MVKLTKITDINKKPDARWKKFKHDDDNPDCQHCKFDRAEKSIPVDEFEIKFKGVTQIIKEITVVRGRFDDCIGWKY